MWNPLFLTAALALGQPGAELPDIAPPPPPPRTLRAPASLLPDALDPAILPAPPGPPDKGGPEQPPTPPEQPATPITVTAPLLPTPPAAAVPATAPAAPPGWPVTHSWLFMKELQGTYYGGLLDAARINVYGWAEASGTASTAAITNEPMTYNDRANRLLLQQFWIRAERVVQTSGTTEPTWGFRTDFLIGSDYRFTLPRGIWNGQVINNDVNPNNGGFTSNLYGIDPVQFYGEAYFPMGNPYAPAPGLQQGLDIKVGRFYAPFGEESAEAVSTPLVSRSYIFNNALPFSNTGILATWYVIPNNLQIAGGYVIGNDIFFDKGMEGRFTGFVKWTQPEGGRNSVTVGASLGRGKFNDGAPFANEQPGFIAGVTPGSLLSGETLGHNNINVVDVVYTHTFNPVLSYASESVVGWQTNVPAALLTGRQDLAAQGFGTGTAHWTALSQYLFYTMTPRLTGTLRGEVFYDFEGSRIGQEGLTTELTAGLAFKPRVANTLIASEPNGGEIIIRPEVRWDHNGESRIYNVPFNPSHDLFSIACDVILRW